MILAGGTGGHVYPALAVAGVLMARSRNIVWLGTRRGLEARVVPAAGIPIEWIAVSGLRGKGLLPVMLAPFHLSFALLQSLYVMAKHRPAAVLGMGGFVSGPGGVAAWLTRRPLVIHEQNAVAGLTNRLLARLAGVVLQAFPDSFKSSVNAETVGNPVRAEIAAIAAPDRRLANRKSSIRLLVLGGSQGALALNETVPAALSLLADAARPEVRHQSGAHSFERTAETYKKHGIAVSLSPFIEDMAEAYSWADLVICRAGAMTVAEVAAAGLPAIFVPFPAAVDDHQTANAAAMQAAGAATIVQQSALTAEALATLLRSLLSDREELLARSRKARSMARPDALQRISEFCLQAAGDLG